ncbi:MAG: dihydrolipoyl dehydrogenase, partial [Spirochaetales bacterium]|nr:dihydrolipoyl dehydrogenase [Spirochaetales bacterium]
SLRVNEFGETSLPGVFAAGDINGEKMLAHAAYSMGAAAARNACIYCGIIQGAPNRYDLDFVPSVVYSHPEAAGVGLTGRAASADREISVGRFPLSANGRALASSQGEGFVKVIADRRYGQILGVHCVGMNASELINEAALSMAMELTVHEVAETIHSHPTISEAFKEAAADCIGQSLHLQS